MKTRIAIVGKTPESSKELEREVEKYGFEMDEKNPQIVLSYGGDGTFLKAERKYPGVPKVLIRKSRICKKCHNLATSHVLEMISKGKYRVKEFSKIEAVWKGKSLLAANDLVLRNILPTKALRFQVWIDSKKINGELIGDGIVVATTFGSTAYFKSITGKTFKKGIGIAFNNLTSRLKCILLNEKSKIRVLTTRGNAHLAGDNNPRIYKVPPNSEIIIKASSKKARIAEVWPWQK